jgi:imidazolonepropionase-like amidohydrolase
VLPDPVAISGELGRQVGASRAASLEALRRLFSDAGFLAANRGRYDRRELRDLAAHALDLEALQPVIAGELPLAVYANGAGDIRSLIGLAKEFGIRLVIQGGAEAWRVADELAAARVPVIVHPSQNVPASLDALGARLDNAARLAAAGVPLAIAIVGGAHNVRNLTQEAGIAVANGLPWEVALTALTLGPARIYGMERRYGSVEPGKIANLVVWGGDPFEHSNWAERVFIRGREIPMVSRQTLLRDRYRDPGSRAPAR